MSERPPVERTTRYATTVTSLDQAFSFIMANLDQVGDLLNVDIHATWTTADDQSVKRFSVVVEGMASLPPYEREGL